MKIAYCPTCKKTTGYKRNIGVGTLLGSIVTLGGSLLAVPFYPKRCVVCGGELQYEISGGPKVQSVDIKRLNIEDSLMSLPKEYIVRCPYCNQYIRSDSIECPLCAMIIPEDIRIIIPSDQSVDPKDYKKCPFCAEDIKVEAIKCKHCGSMLQ